MYDSSGHNVSGSFSDRFWSPDTYRDHSDQFSLLGCKVPYVLPKYNLCGGYVRVQIHLYLGTVPQITLLHCPALLNWCRISTTALSTLATWCRRYVHSCIVNSCKCSVPFKILRIPSINIIRTKYACLCSVRTVTINLSSSKFLWCFHAIDRYLPVIFLLAWLLPCAPTSAD